MKLPSSPPARAARTDEPDLQVGAQVVVAVVDERERELARPGEVSTTSTSGGSSAASAAASTSHMAVADEASRTSTGSVTSRPITCTTGIPFR